VLITGATGFAGSFLVDQYLAAGWEVHGTTRGRPGEIDPDRAVALHVLDLQDADAVRSLVRGVLPDVVCHLAAQSSVAASFGDPFETYRDNVLGQLHLLQAVSALTTPPRVLVVGSCDEYGPVRPEDNPVREDQPLRPATPYAVSKVGQDLMGLQYWLAAELPVVRVRPFLQLGPRRSAQFVAGSVARQIAQIAAGLREPVLEVGTIDLERDFTDVRDVARAYALAMERGRPGEVYNIASGQAQSLRRMIALMLESAGVEAEIRSAETLRRRGEAPLLVGDARKLQEETGWHPEIGFARSARDTVEYWLDRAESGLSR
jgi:GDP-4-dehydro-6-deoxy-D-mannose reductase